MNPPEGAARSGFERMAEELGAQTREYIAVYGLLRSDAEAPDKPQVMSELKDRGRCKIRGDLYDLGGYPGLVAGDGVVVGQLFELEDLTAFGELDRYERYDVDDRSASLYLRRAVRLVEPRKDAWVYVYNQPVKNRPRVVSGDWLSYVSAKELRG